MVGATATPLNSMTKRTCNCDPAEPRRRSTQTRVKRTASTAPSSNSNDRLVRTRVTPRPACNPNGEPRAMMTKVATPTASAIVVRTRVAILPTTSSPSADNQRRGVLSPISWGGFSVSSGGDAFMGGVCRIGEVFGKKLPPASSHQAPDHRDIEIANLLAQRVPVQAQHRRSLDLIAARHRQSHAN